MFPPYMGGCIGTVAADSSGRSVSSLHGRVYHKERIYELASGCFLPTWEGVSHWLTDQGYMQMFPPYMGGCIGDFSAFHRYYSVSSLHGRVYRLSQSVPVLSISFLPTWEGVSSYNFYKIFSC